MSQNDETTFQPSREAVERAHLLGAVADVERAAEELEQEIDAPDRDVFVERLHRAIAHLKRTVRA